MKAARLNCSRNSDGRLRFYPGALAVFILSFFPSCFAQVYLDNLPASHPAIRYFETSPDDPVSRLARQVEAGRVSLNFGSDTFGYLADLLDRLGIDPDSQALVFSKSSFQGAKISPRNPRAIYFNDEAAVGYVPGGIGLEVEGVDPKQGVILYSLTRDDAGKPRFQRKEICLTCHQGPSTLGVPGIFIGSVFPNADGMPAREGAIVTDHRTPFEDRWGGWYVTATRGEQHDRANAVASDPAAPEELDSIGVRQNLISLDGRFNLRNYLRPTSDIVALMTFEHQTQMTNFLTRLGWEARIAAHDAKENRQIDADIAATVDYMLFADEAPLREPIEGVSSFTRTFPKKGPRDRLGRSLRDFDLRTRLFRYPLSYMIYSPLFDALPDSVRDRVCRRLHEILTGADTSAKFRNLTPTDRRAILEILENTKPNLPLWWR